MKKYCVVQGPKECLAYGGWVEIDAPDKYVAYELFRDLYPNGINGTQKPVTVLTQEELWEHMPRDTQGAHACCRGKITVTKE